MYKNSYCRVTNILKHRFLKKKYVKMKKKVLLISSSEQQRTKHEILHKKVTYFSKKCKFEHTVKNFWSIGEYLFQLSVWPTLKM